MGQIELNCVLMLNWIVWNRTVFDIGIAYLCKIELFVNKKYTYAKLDCLKFNLALNDSKRVDMT